MLERIFEIRRKQKIREELKRIEWNKWITASELKWIQLSLADEPATKRLKCLPHYVSKLGSCVCMITIIVTFFFWSLLSVWMTLALQVLVYVFFSSLTSIPTVSHVKFLCMLSIHLHYIYVQNHWMSRKRMRATIHKKNPLPLLLPPPSLLSPSPLSPSKRASDWMRSHLRWAVVLVCGALPTLIHIRTCG